MNAAMNPALSPALNPALNPPLNPATNLRMKRTLATCIGWFAAVLAAPAVAGDFNDIKTLSQEAFRQLSRDLASVTALRALSPGVTLSLLGADIGFEVGITKVDNTDVWRRAGGGSTDVVTPRLTIHKGLAAGFDIGASIGTAGSSGINTVGGIVRYQFVEPTTLGPGVTLRLTGNREYGSSTVDVRSLGADLILAKPLVIVTPYVGVGTVHTNTKARSTGLASESVNRSRLFVGFDTRLAFATVSAEAEKSGGATSVASKIGFRF